MSLEIVGHGEVDLKSLTTVKRLFKSGTEDNRNFREPLHLR
jgi:hypothetical protein